MYFIVFAWSFLQLTHNFVQIRDRYSVVLATERLKNMLGLHLGKFTDECFEIFMVELIWMDIFGGEKLFQGYISGV